MRAGKSHLINGLLGVTDLRGDVPVRIGAPSAVARDGNHAAGRTLSGAVHGGAPEVDMFSVLVEFAVPNTVADARAEGLYREFEAGIAVSRSNYASERFPHV